MTVVLRALVVEDEPQVAIVTRGFVERHPGFQVVAVAPTGEQALDAVETLAPDVVLLDVHLPDISGLTVLRRLRSRGSRVEVVAVTAARDLETVRMARTQGVRHYLVKPFDMQTLHQRLDDVHRAVVQERSLAASTLDQAGIDAVLGSSSAGPRLVRKGVNDRTLQTVEAALAEAGSDASAAEVAERIGMSRVSARRYLERLVELGVARVEPRYGSAGRPEHRYTATGS
ncbi:response regulator [Agrococcus jejuensis]|uniref:response regulator n=1 Tax=Agrococcus jejuensis TaxID=399736 RepID=UPI0011A8140D|nr:response regulator [Agrococcus jejuensis]